MNKPIAVPLPVGSVIDNEIARLTAEMQQYQSTMFLTMRALEKTVNQINNLQELKPQLVAETNARLKAEKEKAKVAYDKVVAKTDKTPKIETPDPRLVQTFTEDTPDDTK